MFVVNEDYSIHATRGDIVFFSVSADECGEPYEFQAGEVVRLKIYDKKNAKSVVLQKDFPVTQATDKVGIFLSSEDTKFGDVISKPTDYWYEVELNPFNHPQTLVGYDDDGAKVFKLFPEGNDVPEFVPDPEDIRIMDTELDMTSTRPVQNQAIAREIAVLKADFAKARDAATLAAERFNNLIAHEPTDLDQSLAYMDYITEATQAKIGAEISSDGVHATIRVHHREANLIYGGTNMDVFIIPTECRPIDTGLIHAADGMEYRINYDAINNRYVLNLCATATVAPSGAGTVTMTYALGDYELMDIRVGADGKTYATAGEAVRKQLEAFGASSDVVTPQMFGAVGDGITDDSSAFQACFDASVGKTIVIPDKKYRLNSPVKLKPEIYFYNIQGMGTRLDDIPNYAVLYKEKDPHILCGSHFLDGTGTDGFAKSYCVNVRDIKVAFGYDDSTKDFLHNIVLSRGVIRNCSVMNADRVIFGGMRGRAVIDGCLFGEVKNACFKDGDFENPSSPVGFLESTITNCYAHGNSVKGYNPYFVESMTFFKMNVIDCFADFFKCIIGRVEGMTDNSPNFDGTLFLGCTFDIVWRVFTSHHYGMNPVTFECCKFVKVSQDSIATYFTAPDEDMLSGGVYSKCGVVVNDTDAKLTDSIKYKQENICGVRILNSTFEKVDYPIYLAPAAWEHKDIVEKGNVFYDFQGNTPVTLRLYATTSDQVKTNHFESLNGKDFTKLPLCHVTESSPGFAECFEGMSVFYNGKPAICHNLKWYDYAGNVLA